MVRKIAEMAATVMGLGYLPLMPGTWGSLPAFFLILLVGGNPFFCLVLFALSFTAGAWASGKVEADTGCKDPSFVVIDEFASAFLVLLLVPLTVPNIVGGFALYRFFDIVKPWPARRLEKIKGGSGIMLDDIVAGVYAWAVLSIVSLLFS
jgi:phosphatidylglycerophosphatase A